MKLTPEQEGFLQHCEDNLLDPRRRSDLFLFVNPVTQAAWVAWTCRGAWEPPNSSEYLPVIRRRFDEYSLHQPQYNWQVVFKTKDGHDWGRLTRAGNTPLQAVEQWASQFCLANELAGAHIERW